MTRPALLAFRCENRTQAPVTVDLEWQGEMYARTGSGTGGP